MIEDYAIHTRLGMSESIGYIQTKNGRTKRGTRFIVKYKTDAGILEPEEWRQKALTEIDKQGEQDTLEAVKEHAREHCAWLHGEEEIEEYAIECTCSRAYLYWPDFKEMSETIIWM